MQYSVIIPLYNEENNFAELHQRAQKTLAGTGASYEIIFVDDGSQDSTADLIEEKNKGYSVVYAIKSNRKESFIKKGLTSVFYRLLHFLPKVEMPRNVGTFSIFSRNVAWNIITLKENNKFIAGLRAYVGFKQKGLAYSREKRTQGEPKSIFSLLRMKLNAIFSFSILPLRITMLATLTMGTFTLLILFAMASQYFKNTFSGGNMTNWIIFFLLIQIFLMLSTLTIVCEYIGRIHEQIKRRPDFIIESIIIDEQVIADLEGIQTIENTLEKVSA